MTSKPMHKSLKRRQKKKKHGVFSPWRVFKWVMNLVVVIAVCGMIGYIYILYHGEQLLEENLARLDMPETTIMYDANSNELYRFYLENRSSANIEELPELLIQAFIAKEDKRFYEHEGLDFWAIGRAVVVDIAQGSLVQGGSTITQQLAKNVFLYSDKTIFRKATEAAIAVALENNYTKDEIMQLYLNTIFFGHQAYGVKAAAKVYFDKDDLSQLELWEMATLAAIPKAPSLYNPLTDPEVSKQQRQIVLKLMYEQGYITEEQMDEAADVDYVPPSSAAKTSGSQAFIDYALEEAKKETGLTDEELRVGGYRIYTTLNAQAQQAVEDTLNRADWYVDDDEEQKVEASMVIVDHHSGAIQALYGGRDYTFRGTNWALEQRQPGSSIKPIVVYAPALESGQWQPYSLLPDKLTSYSGYTPRNYDDQYDGEVTMMDAIGLSKNTSAVWLLQQMGIDQGIEYAESVGIQVASEDYNLALALGGMTYGVSPLQMAQAYSPFAAEGTWTEAFTVLKIEDSKGRVIYEHKENKKQVLSKQTAYEMTRMLEEAVRSGSGQNAQMNRAVAGKTGTTQVGIDGIQSAVANRDVWFVGYTPEWTAAVWLGFPQTSSTHYLTISSSVPAQIFAESMTAALAGTEASSFTKPEGVEEIQQPPSAPQDVTIDYDESRHVVTVEWSPVAGDVRYELYRKKDDGDTEYLISSVFPNVHDMTIEEGSIYDYYVVTVDENTGLKSSPSSNVTVEIPEQLGLEEMLDDLQEFLDESTDEESQDHEEDQHQG